MAKNWFKSQIQLFLLYLVLGGNMEIWLDTSNIVLAGYASNLGILDGVTTNPTILSQSKINPRELIEQFLKVQKGLVAVQVLADDVNTMLARLKPYTISLTE